MTDLIRWHTEPEETPFTGYSSSTERRQKELSELINSNSTKPLYWEIQDNLSSPTNLDREDREWLQSIRDVFDSYVIKILNGLHIRPWDFDYNIRKEYELEYGVFPPTDLPLRGVMGRLMSYKEIWNYVYEFQSSAGVTDWFWRRPQIEPIWTLDCISGGYRNEKTQPFRTTMTGLNPRDLRRAYEVVLERPWTSRLDPVHHWGVYMDQGDYYYKDDPVRILMACCAEHVGHTDGCWIALRGDPTALEGVIKPYQVFPYVFRNVWEKGIIPSEDAIKKDVVWGTAFKDYARYELLHNRIQAGLDAAAKAIRSGYGKYQKVLEAVLDSPGSDSKRDRYPYESNAVLSDLERESIASVIRLQYEFNAIQCIGEMPLMADYVNKHIFKVSDMLIHFTYDKMGAELEGVPNEKLKFFSTSGLEDPQKVKAFTDSIEKAEKEVPANFQPGGKYAFLTAVSKSALALQKQLEYFQTQQVNYLLLKSLLSNYIAMDLKVLPSATLSTIENSLKDYETRQTETIAKQAEFNTVVENIRNNSSAAVPAENLIQPQPLKANGIETLRILIASQTMIRTPAALPLKPAKLQTIYDTIKQAETKATAVLQRPLNVAIPERLKLQTQKYFTPYQTIINRIDKDLNDIINTNFPRLITYLTLLNDSLADDPVKEQVLKDLDVEPNVTDAQNVIQVAETDKIVAEKQLEKEVVPIIQQYQVEQTQKRDAVNTKLEEMKQSVVPLLPLTQVDPKAEIEKRIKPLLEALPLLIDVDDLNQLGLKYEKRVGEILSLLPTEKEISDTETAKPKDDVRLNFIAAWNSPQSLYGAAKDLADALAALLALGGNTQNVDTLLDSAEEKAKEARGFIESKTVRLARLERERLERERLAREAENRRLELERQRLKRENDLKVVFDWLNTTNRTNLFQNSLVPLTKMDEYLNTKNQADPTFPIFYDNLKTSLDFLGKSFFVRTVDNVDTLIGRWEDNDTFTLSPDGEYKSLYLEGLSDDQLDVIKETYRMFALVLVHYGQPDHTQYVLNFEKSLNDYENVLPEQPIAWELDFTSKSNIIDVSDISQRHTPVKMYAENHVISTSYLKWKEMSCWMDASYVALFSIPETTLSKTLFEKTKLVQPSTALRFMSGKVVIVVDKNNLSQCTSQKLKQLHENILLDIKDIQDSTPGEKAVCRSKKNWSRDFGCVKSPALGLDETPDMVFESLVPLYQLENILKFEYNPKMRLYIVDSVIEVPVGTTVPFYVQGIPSKKGWRTFQEARKQLDSRNITSWVIPTVSNGYSLAGIIRYNGGHYNAYVRDFVKKEWMFVDNNARKAEWTKDLPIDVYNFEAFFAISHVIYFSDAEVKRIVALNASSTKIVQPTPAPQGPPPTPAPTPKASVLEISDNLNEPVPYGNPLRIEELFNASKQASSQEAYALLDKTWNDAKPIIEKLDEVRLEGLLHVWWALRNKGLSDEERQQRIVVGISRADLDLTILQGPPPVVITPTAPPPTVVTPTVPTPQGPPATVITPQAPPLNVLTNTGLELYPNPKDVVSFEDAFNQAQSLLLNRPELGLGPRFDDVKEVGMDRYRLTGLMHAWWGAAQNPPNVEAQVRGMSMADL